METTTKLATIETRVERLMERYPETRSNDRLLIEAYLFKYHGVTSFCQYRKDSDLPTIESITRLRRKIQKAGRCLPDEAVNDGRGEAEYTYVGYCN